MLTLISFIIILGLAVVFHEFGHFITARKSGMKVYEFGIGMPPRAFGFYRDPKTKKIVWVRGKGKSNLIDTAGGGDRSDSVDPLLTSSGRPENPPSEDEFPATIWSLNWLPLGGFCKIKGENGEAGQESDSFGAQKAWKRVVVLVAGVTMNVILAGILLSIGFMIGLPADMSGGVDDSAIILQESQIMVQMIDEGSPADKAGIKYGDRIFSVGGVELATTVELVEYLKTNKENTENYEVVVYRGEEELVLNLQTEQIKENEEYPRFGFASADAGLIRYPWYIAIYKGFGAALVGVVNIFIAFYLLIKNLIVGQGLAFQVAGPVGIAVMVGDSARLGISYLINVAAMISLSLAVINILPIPALDGGRIVFILIEKIIGRPVPVKYEQAAHTIGFLLLMLLIVVVTFRDVIGLIK